MYKRCAFLLVAILVFALFTLVPKSVPVTSADGISLPVIMYHSVLDKVSSPSDYIVTVAQLDEDMRYLAENGYTAVTCKELIKYTQNVAPLPEKPVLITFDDGMYNNFTNALPVLEKYNFPAVFSIVGSYTDEYTKSRIKNKYYSYITWQDISSYSENPLVEFGNHSYNLHSIGQRYAAKRKKNETFSEYLSVFLSDTQKMQMEFFSTCSFKPVIYTYPFGEFCKDSERILKKNGFLVTFSCIEGVNKITKDPECLFLLKRNNRSGKLTTYEFFKKLRL